MNKNIMVIIIVVLVLIVGGYYYFNMASSDPATLPIENSEENTVITPATNSGSNPGPQTFPN